MIREISPKNRKKISKKSLKISLPHFRKQKEFCEKLQNFLLNEINFREVTVKELSTMTTGMFHEIFSALVRNILGPNYLSSLGKMKVPEMIVETMQALNYPIKLVKSSFVNLTKQTFPTALGVLGSYSTSYCI